MSERREQATGKTRVVYVVDNISFRGGERTFLQLVSGLPRSRYDLAVACSPGGVFVDRLHDLGVPVIDAEMRQRRRLDTVLSLARQLRRRRPHIVHTQGRGDPFGRIAARLARVPAVISTTAAIAARYVVQEKWRRTMYRGIDLVTDPFVDRFIVVNRASVSTLTDRHRIGTSRIAVIPNGIEIERHDPARVVRGDWRDSHGVPQDAKLIGAVGRLSWEKGFEDLIKAFAALDDPDLYLAVAGDGPEWGDLRALATGLDVSRRVIFAGFEEDVPGLLGDLDLFVLSSLREGHPMVLLEAMAMGLPVVATDIAGVDETITEGVDGRLVAAGDVPAMVRLVRELLDNPDAANRMGRNARKRIEKEYTVDRMVRRTAILYDEVLAEKGIAV